MADKKIIQIITRLDKGGSSRIVLELSAWLCSQGYPLKIISGLTENPQQDLVKFSEGLGIEIIFIKQLRRSINPFLDFLSFFKLYSILRKEKPSIVHTHTSKAGILGRWAAKAAGIRIIIHMPHGHIFYGYFGKIKTAFFIFLERITALFTDKIVTLSEIGKREHVNFGIAQEGKFIVIPNGIGLEKYANFKIDRITKRMEFHLSQGDYLITLIGRLEPIKGHIYFFEALKEIIRELPQARALIAGGGSLRSELEDEAKRLDISNAVLFIGERDDVAEIIFASDLVVLPSLNEGFGLVLLEAGILGRPVIATGVGGIPEVVLDNKTGLIIPPKDSTAIVRAVLRLAKDESLYQSISQEAKKRISNNFSSDQMLNKFKKLYEDLLTAKGIS